MRRLTVRTLFLRRSGGSAGFIDSAVGGVRRENERHIVSVFKLIQDLLEPEKRQKSPAKLCSRKAASNP